MFRLWSTGSGGDKSASEKAKLAGSRPSTLLIKDTVLENQMKRKRSDSGESASGGLEQSQQKRWPGQGDFAFGNARFIRPSSGDNSISDFGAHNVRAASTDQRAVQADSVATVLPAQMGKRAIPNSTTCPS